MPAGRENKFARAIVEVLKILYWYEQNNVKEELKKTKEDEDSDFEWI